MTYDYVCSLGQWCATAILLKKSGLRSFSGPFDWFKQKSGLRSYVDAMTSGFSGFMRKENLRRLREIPGEGKAAYVDGVTGFESYHDFEVGVSLDESYDRFAQKMQRRIERFLSVFGRSNRVLLVHWQGEGRCIRQEVCSETERLRAHFPAARIDLLVMETERFRAGIGKETPGSGIAVVTGDFYDPDRYDPVLGNEKLVLRVLKEIRMRGRWRNLLRVRIASFRKRLGRHLAGERR